MRGMSLPAWEVLARGLPRQIPPRTDMGSAGLADRRLQGNRDGRHHGRLAKRGQDIAPQGALGMCCQTSTPCARAPRGSKVPTATRGRGPRFPVPSAHLASPLQRPYSWVLSYRPIANEFVVGCRAENSRSSKPVLPSPASPARAGPVPSTASWHIHVPGRSRHLPLAGSFGCWHPRLTQDLV